METRRPAKLWGRSGAVNSKSCLPVGGGLSTTILPGEIGIAGADALGAPGEVEDDAAESVGAPRRKAPDGFPGW